MAVSIHNTIALIAVVAIGGGVGWAAYLAISDRSGGPRFVRFQAAVVAVLVVAAASGALLLAIGASPSESLHFLYAILAIALIPLARSSFSHARRRRQALAMLVAFVVLGGVLFRLFASG